MTQGQISVPITALHCPSLSRNRPVTAASAIFYTRSRPLLHMLFPSPARYRSHFSITSFLFVYSHNTTTKLQYYSLDQLSDLLSTAQCRAQTVQRGLDVGSGQSQIPSSRRALPCHLGLACTHVSSVLPTDCMQLQPASLRLSASDSALFAGTRRGHMQCMAEHSEH